MDENEEIDPVTPIERHMERVPVGDPEQCAGVGRTSGDQCPFRRLEGTPYCKLHGGTLIQAKLRREAAKIYDLNKFREKHGHFTLQEAAGLHEELGILRMTLENLVVSCDEVSLHSNSAKIGLLIREIRETLKVNVTLKKEKGELLDKAVLAGLCDALVAIIQKHVPASLMDVVSTEVAEALNQAVKRSKE